MNTNAPQPGRTDPEIFEHGTEIMMILGPRSQTIEDWVVTIAKMTGTKTDWRMSLGGRAIVLVLGDANTCRKVQAACLEQWTALVDMYMACPYNWLATPQRDHVSQVMYEIE